MLETLCSTSFQENNNSSVLYRPLLAANSVIIWK